MLHSGETFRKTERLCSKKVIESLFENGRSFYCHPILVIWTFAGSEIPGPAQVAFSVPKKGFRLAVKRNLIKRRMREAYRKNKNVLYNHLSATGKKIVFTMIYRDKNVADFDITEKAVKQIITYFVKTIAISNADC